AAPGAAVDRAGAARRSGAEARRDRGKSPWRPSLPFDGVHLLANPGRDPAPGDVDGAGRNPQFVGDRVDLVPEDGGPPERLPGGLAKLGADPLRGPLEQVPLILPEPVVLVPRGVLLLLQEL